MSHHSLQKTLTSDSLLANHVMLVATSDDRKTHIRKDSPTADQNEEYCNDIEVEEADELDTDSYFSLQRPLLRATKLSRKHYLYKVMLDASFLNKQELKDLQRRYAANIWPNGTTFRLAFLNKHGSEVSSLASVIEGHHGWSRGANLDFSRTLDASDSQSTRPRTLPVAEIRVLIDKQNRADLGLNAVFAHPAYPTMVLETSATQGAVLHEFGHILGIQHEHQRWIGDIEFDIQAARKYLWGFSDPAGDVLDKYEDTKIDPFEYDPDSIMHYCFHEYGEDAFVSVKPHQKDRLTDDQFGLTIKDQKLIAYLYPLPAGGYLKPQTNQYSDGRLPRAQRQVVMLPHVWSSTCRVMLGFASFTWQFNHEEVKFHAQVSAQCKRYFHLESWANRVNAILAYLAIDPATANIQMRSAKTCIEAASMDPDTNHCTELHRLRWNISSKAKVITWIKALHISDASIDFEVCVDYGMRLSYISKRLATHTRSTQGVFAEIDWLVINPNALNIDGGRVHWTSREDSTVGSETFRLGLYSGWDHEVPQVMTAVHGLKYHRTYKHHDNDEVFFKLDVINASSSGFQWEVRICHRECFSALGFSWVVAPKPVTEYFGFPNGDKRPKKYTRSMTQQRGKAERKGDGTETKVTYNGICDLFEAAENKLLHNCVPHKQNQLTRCAN